MAEPNQPKKETVRIELPLPPATKPPGAPAKPRETVRIQLPLRETANPPVPSLPQTGASPTAEDISSTSFSEPPMSPVASNPLSASVRPPQASPPPGPKRETVRIPLMPEPLRSAQKKTQPLMAMPQVAPQNPSIAVAQSEKDSMLLYWMLLSVSALILIIQVWTYFS